MKKVTNENEHRSPDLYFSAYLQVAGLEMIRTEKEGTRFYFVFDTSVGNFEELKAAWYNSTGKVAAQPYSHCLKSLKSLVHSG